MSRTVGTSLGPPRSWHGLSGRWLGATAGRNDAVPLCSGSRRSTGRSGTSAPSQAHKVALDLVRTADVIAREDLAIANMTRSAAGTSQNLGRNVAAKSGLNRSILDAGWGVFFEILTHKAESAGRTVIAVDPRNTSRTCSHCGQCEAGNRDKEAFRCLSCGYLAHADTNAAVNIAFRAGLALRVAQAA